MSKNRQFEIDFSEGRELQRILKEYADKDMQNAMTRANRQTAKLVRDEARKNVAKQPVPLARKSAKGVTSQATRTSATISWKKQATDRHPTLNLANYGSKNWHVPYPPNAKRAGTVFWMDQKNMKNRVGKRWIGNQYSAGDNPNWSTYGKRGYAIEKAVEDMRETVIEMHGEFLHQELVQSFKNRKK